MRRRVNWHQIVIALNDTRINKHFFSLLSGLHKGKSMSANRCAYNALKSTYSTTTIAELCEKLGL